MIVIILLPFAMVAVLKVLANIFGLIATLLNVGIEVREVEKEEDDEK